MEVVLLTDLGFVYCTVGYHKKARFYALNALEFLDSPGEVSKQPSVVV